MSSPAEAQVRVAGRFARRALAAGEGEVCAIFQRSFYLRTPAGFACVGDARLGRGPLNALLDALPAVQMGARLSFPLASATDWVPPPFTGSMPVPKEARPPEEGLGGLVIGRHNALAVHAQPALEAIDRWIVGHSLDAAAEALIGLGPGLTPSGDDYFGGVLVALHAARRGVHAESLWRWLEPRLAERTSELSAAHLAAAAAGEAHEALHEVLNGASLERLDGVGHVSGWDAFAGAMAVLRNYY
jgi:hypothetical protein